MLRKSFLPALIPYGNSYNYPLLFPTCSRPRRLSTSAFATEFYTCPPTTERFFRLNPVLWMHPFFFNFFLSFFLSLSSLHNLWNRTYRSRRCRYDYSDAHFSDPTLTPTSHFPFPDGLPDGLPANLQKAITDFKIRLLQQRSPSPAPSFLL